jgi:hypothetical protein
MGFLKIIGKFFSDTATVVFGGKVVTVKGKDNVEIVKKQLQEYKDAPTEELKDKIDKTINKEKYQQIAQLDKVNEDLQASKVEANSAFVEAEKIVSTTEKTRTKLKTSEFVDYDESNNTYYLKGFQARIPMPLPLVDKLAYNENNNISNLNLINFWMLCMGLEDPRARFDMFKYLVRQKMIITKHGYFVTFRRWISLKTEQGKKDLKGDINELSVVLLEAFDKIKKWKQSPKNYSVVYIKDHHEVVPTKKLKPGQDSSEYRVIGMFKELYDAMIASQTVKEGEPDEHVQWYTDGHSKTFKMRIGHPVKMPREKCNNNPNQECSFGLHVGTPYYVGSSTGSSLGDTIVACLVNPLHVISVPYSDAHKMRVCEYYPFKVMTHQEMSSFEEKDVANFEDEYMNFEWAELEKQLNNPDSQVFDDGTLLKGVDYVKTEADLQALREKLSAIDQNIDQNDAKKKAVLNQDPINSELSTADMKAIIASRVIKK